MWLPLLLIERYNTPLVVFASIFASILVFALRLLERSNVNE